MRKDLTSIADLGRDEIARLFDRARELKYQVARAHRLAILEGRVMALVFEKPSLRTRVTFETAIIQLGGSAIYLAPGDIGLGKRETVPDVARNLSRWVHIVAARTFAHRTILELSRHATVPVVNALSDEEHPCQALGDFLTISEYRQRLEGTVLAWVGDGNNVCNSLMLAAGLLGVHMKIGVPAGYGPRPEFLKLAQELGAATKAEVIVTTDPVEAVRDADFVYTDVWTSMGYEDQAEERRRAFLDYQVNTQLLTHAPRTCRVMHCLPAHRGDEITDEVLDGPQSIVLEQAESRLHIQRAIIAELLRVC